MSFLVAPLAALAAILAFFGLADPALDHKVRGPMQQISDRLRVLCDGAKKAQKGQALEPKKDPKK